MKLKKGDIVFQKHFRETVFYILIRFRGSGAAAEMWDNVEVGTGNYTHFFLDGVFRRTAGYEVLK